MMFCWTQIVSSRRLARIQVVWSPSGRFNLGAPERDLWMGQWWLKSQNLGRGPRAQRALPMPRMLRSNRISCIHNDSFTGLRNVRLLSLYDNQIATIAPGAFDTLQALSTL